MASAVNTTPVSPRSWIICWAAGISFDLSSISVCARTIAEAEANAVNVWAALRSLMWSKLPSQRLAVEGDQRPFAGLGCRQQGFGMAPECVFESSGRQRLQHRPQRVHRRRSLQGHSEMVIEVLPALLQKRDDAAVDWRRSAMPTP